MVSIRIRLSVCWVVL